MRLLLTRPEPDASQMQPALEAIGCQVVLEPLLTIRFMPDAPLVLNDVQALIATSRNGLRALMSASDPLLLQTARQFPLFAVGTGTYELAQDMGFAKLFLGPGQADQLPQMIARHVSPDAGDLLHLAGADLAVDLKPSLHAAGFTVQTPVVYQAIQRQAFTSNTLQLFHSGKIDSVLLMSPRTAATYATLINKAQLSEIALKMTHFCLSDRIARRLGGLGTISKEISLKPNMQEMLALIAKTVAKK